MLLKAVSDKSIKFLSFILSFVILVGTMSVSAFALTESEKQEYRDEIEEIKQEIAENQEKIDELNEKSSEYDPEINDLQSKIDILQDQIDLFNEEIALIDADIEKVDQQISSIETEINSLNKKIKKLDDQVVALEQEKADTYVLLGERIRASYMAGASTPLEFILTSDDFEFLAYLERVELLRRIAENDDALIKTLEENIVEIGVKVTEIEDVKKRLNVKVSELDEAKLVHEAKKDERVEARKEVESKEALIQKDLDKIMAVVNELDAESQEYQDIINKREDAIWELEQKLAEQNTYYGSGAAGDMVWPLPYEDAYISSSYKMRTLNGVTRMHNGVDTCRWGGTHGADIISVKDGTVAVASWGYGGGYGNYVVVNHGNGVTTYYAHLSNITVSVGQSVKQGQVIGNAGNTGYSFGAHLHFGVMVNGSWVNPTSYVPRQTPGGKYIESTDGY